MHPLCVCQPLHVPCLCGDFALACCVQKSLHQGVTRCRTGCDVVLAECRAIAGLSWIQTSSTASASTRAVPKQLSSAIWLERSTRVSSTTQPTGRVRCKHPLSFHGILLNASLSVAELGRTPQGQDLGLQERGHKFRHATKVHCMH